MFPIGFVLFKRTITVIDGGLCGNGENDGKGHDAEDGEHPSQRLLTHRIKPTEVLAVSDGHGVFCRVVVVVCFRYFFFVVDDDANPVNFFRLPNDANRVVLSAVNTVDSDHLKRLFSRPCEKGHLELRGRVSTRVVYSGRDVNRGTWSDVVIAHDDVLDTQFWTHSPQADPLPFEIRVVRSQLGNGARFGI